MNRRRVNRVVRARSPRSDVAFIDLTRLPHTDEGVLTQALETPIRQLQAGSFLIFVSRWEKQLLTHDPATFKKLAAETKHVDKARGERLLASLFRYEKASTRSVRTGPPRGAATACRGEAPRGACVRLARARTRPRDGAASPHAESPRR